MIPNEMESLISFTIAAMDAIDMDDQDNEEALEASTTIAEDVSEEEAFPCQYDCGKSFSTVHLQNKHHKIHNPTHTCPYCNRRFPVTRDK
jgi:hypothetical protein